MYLGKYLNFHLGLGKSLHERPMSHKHVTSFHSPSRIGNLPHPRTEGRNRGGTHYPPVRCSPGYPIAQCPYRLCIPPPAHSCLYPVQNSTAKQSRRRAPYLLPNPCHILFHNRLFSLVLFVYEGEKTGSFRSYSRILCGIGGLPRKYWLSYNELIGVIGTKRSTG